MSSSISYYRFFQSFPHPFWSHTNLSYSAAMAYEGEYRHSFRGFSNGFYDFPEYHYTINTGNKILMCSTWTIRIKFVPPALSDEKRMCWKTASTYLQHLMYQADWLTIYAGMKLSRKISKEMRSYADEWTKTLQITAFLWNLFLNFFLLFCNIGNIYAVKSFSCMFQPTMNQLVKVYIGRHSETQFTLDLFIYIYIFLNSQHMYMRSTYICILCMHMFILHMLMPRSSKDPSANIKLNGWIGSKQYSANFIIQNTFSISHEKY